MSRLGLSWLLLTCLVLSCLLLTRLLLSRWVCLSLLTRSLWAFLAICWSIGLIYSCRIGRRSVSRFFFWLLSLSRRLSTSFFLYGWQTRFLDIVADNRGLISIGLILRLSWFFWLSRCLRRRWFVKIGWLDLVIWRLRASSCRLSRCHSFWLARNLGDRRQVLAGSFLILDRTFLNRCLSLRVSWGSRLVLIKVYLASLSINSDRILRQVSPNTRTFLTLVWGLNFQTSHFVVTI